MYEETLFQNHADGTPFVEKLKSLGVIPGIKVDTGLEALPGGDAIETWCTGLDGLLGRAQAYYKQGARFAKWRTVLQISSTTPTALCQKEAAWGLARYARTVQEAGLVPIVEPEILMDGDHDIETTARIQEKVLAEVYKYLSENGVYLEGSLLKPSMTVPGADSKKPVKAEVGHPRGAFTSCSVIYERNCSRKLVSDCVLVGAGHCQVHHPDARAHRAVGRAGRYLPLWRHVGGGGVDQPVYHELDPAQGPVVPHLLLRPRPATGERPSQTPGQFKPPSLPPCVLGTGQAMKCTNILDGFLTIFFCGAAVLPQDVAGQARERQGGAGGAAGPRPRQLAGQPWQVQGGL